MKKQKGFLTVIANLGEYTLFCFCNALPHLTAVRSPESFQSLKSKMIFFFRISVIFLIYNNECTVWEFRLSNTVLHYRTLHLYAF